MSATLTAGLASLILNIDTPLESDLVTPRDDLIGVKVWVDTSSASFTPSNDNLVFDGNSLSITIPNLTFGTVHYVKYALISDIEPENYVVSNALSSTPLESTYVEDSTPPPTPTGVIFTAGISSVFVSHDEPTYTVGHGHSRSILFGKEYTGGALPVYEDSISLGEFTGSTYSFSTDPATTWRLWLVWVSNDGIASTIPFGGTNGIVVTTADDPSKLVTALAGEITETELASSLNSRIDLIDGSVNTVGTIPYQINQEALARQGAIELESHQRLISVQDTANSALTAIIAVNNERVDRTADVALARSELNTNLQDGLAAEASARLALTTVVNQNTADILSEQLTRSTADSALASDITTLFTEVGDNAAAISAESLARSNADSAEATQRNLLATQMRGDYTGSDLAAITSGLLYQEKQARSNQDTALALSISLLSAGVGEQFDWSKIWYFDSGVDGWTGNGSPSVTNGFLRPADNASDPYLISPSGLGINSTQYQEARLRIRKTGSPTFDGYLWWNATGQSWNTSRRYSFSEPSYDSNGLSVLTLTIPWTATSTIDQVKIELSSAQTSTDYFEIDWIAFGRPSPGASTAQILEEAEARATAISSEATSRTTLKSSLMGTADPSTATLAGLTSGLIFDEKSARTTADAAEATARNTLKVSLIGTDDPSTATLAGLTSGLIFDEKSARVTAISAEASARDVLKVALIGDADPSTDGLADVTTGIISEEKTARTSGDAAEATARNTLKVSLIGAADPSTATLEDLTSGLLFEEKSSRIDAINQVTLDSAYSALELRTVSKTADSLAESSLRNSINDNNNAVQARSEIALARQELQTNIVEGLSAEASARLTLETKVDQNYSTIVDNYYTKSSTDSAIAQKATLLRAYSNISSKTFTQSTAPTTRGTDPDTGSTVALQIGDVWINTADSNRQSTWSGTAWVSRTDTSSLESFITETFDPTIQDITDGKIEFWDTTTDPSTTWSGTAGSHTGDLWYNSSTKLLKNWNGSTWVVIEDSTAIAAAEAAADAQDTADGKITTFAQNDQPTAEGIGDLWIDTNDNNKPYRWNGSSWIEIRDGNIAAVDARVTTVETTKIGYCTINGAATDQTTKSTCEEAGGVWTVGLPLASAVKQVSVQDANGSTASVEQAFIAQKTLNDSFKLQYSVKLDNNGYVSGYGLYNSGTNSEFIVNVDKFAVTSPDSAVPLWQANTSYSVGNSVRYDYNTELMLVCKVAGTSGASTYTLSQASIEILEIVAGLNPGTPLKNLLLTQVNGRYIGDINNSGSVNLSDSVAINGYIAGSTANAAYIEGTLIPAINPVGLTTGQIIEDGTVVWQVSSRVPFAVLSTSSTINGVTLGPGAYIDGASINNATINTAQIADAAITNAKIDSLDATKITTGFIDAARISAGSIVADKIDTKNLTIKDSSGNVIFSSGSSTTGSKNLIVNAGFSSDYLPATAYLASNSNATVSYLYNQLGAPLGYGSMKFIATGSVYPSGEYRFGATFENSKIQVTPDEKIEVSCYVGIYRGIAKLSVTWLNSLGAVISEVFIEGTGTSNGTVQTLTNYLSDFDRLYGFVTVPANATHAYLSVKANRNNTSANTELYVTLPYIGRASSSQTVASDWVDGPDRITADKASTFIADAAITNSRIGNVIYSSNFNGTVNEITGDVTNYGTQGWILTKSGSAILRNAVVTGTVQADAGYFKGSLEGANITGATGNFSGQLNGANITGATGVFSGSLSAGAINAGVSTNYTVPGTYTLTVPNGFTTMKWVLVGGGGGGGSGTATYTGGTYPYRASGGGGGGGGVHQGSIAVSSGQQFTLYVGAGGTGGYNSLEDGQSGLNTVNGFSGSSGGTTYIAGIAAAYGGGGGGGAYNGGVSGTGGAGGSGTNNGSAGASAYLIFVDDGDTGYYVPSNGGNGGNSGLSFGYGGAGGSYANQNWTILDGKNGGSYGGGGGGGSFGYNQQGYGGGGDGGSGRAYIEFYNANGVVVRSEFTNLINQLQTQLGFIYTS